MVKFDYPLRPFQVEAGKAWRGHVAAGRQRGLVALPTGCHAKGQGVLMLDGRVKPVEQVAVGDQLMGMDGTGRTVLTLIRGIGEMVKVTPTKGAPFVVNDEHILSLVKTASGTKYPSDKGGTIVDLSVREYLSKSATFKHAHKLFRTGVEFPAGPALTLDPYFMGIFLGDGSFMHSTVSVSKPDAEIESAVRLTAFAFGDDVNRIDGQKEDGSARCPTYNVVSRFHGTRSNVAQCLEALGLRGLESGERFIPSAYKTASLSARLGLLAGLLDTDGSLSCNTYDYISKSRAFADDVAFVARSSGFAAYVAECEKGCQTGAVGTYYRVNISGETSRIPCRLPRKKATARRQKKSVLRTGFHVGYVGQGEFFGFVLDGDRRYLMDDFTVTHNCGKTIFALSLVPESGRTLFLVHRDALAHQTVEAARRVMSDIDVGIVMAGEDCVGARDLVVASVPTLSRQARLDRLIEAQVQYGDFKYIVADEAHHAAAKTWLKVLDSFRASTIGVTATPSRNDDKGLAHVWGPEPIYRMTIDQAINGECPMIDGTITQHDGGWLVPYQSRTVECDTLDMSHVRVNPETGDYDLSDVEKEVYRTDFARFVANVVKGVADEGRHTIVFCTSVDQANRTCEYLEEMKVSATCADGDTSPELRKEILASFKAKETRVLVNCQLYVEGADIPEIDCVVNAAPTQSREKYTQVIGRGLRLCPPDKEDLLIVDVVGAHAAHGLVTAANMGEAIVKGPSKKHGPALLLQDQRDREFGMVVSAANAAKFGAKAKDAKKRQRSRWITVSEGTVFALPAGEHGALLMVREPGDTDAWMGFRLPKDAWTFQEARKIMKRPAERAFAAGVIEDRARKLGVFSLSSDAAKWLKLPPTPKQLEQFAKFLPGKFPSSRGEASDMLTAHFLRQSMRPFK